MIETVAVIILLVALISLGLNFYLMRKPEDEYKNKLKDIQSGFEKYHTQLEADIRDEFSRNREEANKNFKSTREEQGNSFKVFSDSATHQSQVLTQIVETKLNHLQEQANHNAKDHREELRKSLEGFGTTFSNNVKDFNELQKDKFDNLIGKQTQLNEMIEKELNKLRETVESQLKSIQEDTNRQLDKMRETVDEKLHKTLEERLGSSFKLVSERLELVQKGLGEMQSLATGVGDLKKVLSNVKTRGVLGEYQLENILEQMLSPEQYGKNVKTKAGSEGHVEFAVKLPSRGDSDKPLWLPIDAKFPVEDYQALNEAYEQADLGLIERSQKVFAKKIELFAKDISAKYIDPPNTTDFAIMFLPVEGLYAEVLRSVGLFEKLQRDYKIAITGPTTISAFLSSLQMGFRTLAIEKRSSEVWDLLGTVKKEFEQFGDVLDKTKKKLQEAGNVIDQAGVRTRAIERKLRDVEVLPDNMSTRDQDDTVVKLK